VKTLKGCLALDFYALFSWTKLLIVIFIFSILSYHSILDISADKENSNIWDLIILTFSGPMLENPSLMDNIKWLFPQILLLFMIGKFIESEWNERSIYTIIRTESIYKWWISKVIIFTAFSLIFFLIGFLTCITMGLFFGIRVESSWSDFANNYVFLYTKQVSSPINVAITIFFLLASSIIVLIFFLFFLTLLINQLTYSYIIVCIVISLAFISNILPDYLITLIPGNQSIASRHSIFDHNLSLFTANWSYIYNSFIALALYFANITILKRRDF
jgi:hypothetical protein